MVTWRTKPAGFQRKPEDPDHRQLRHFTSLSTFIPVESMMDSSIYYEGILERVA